MDPELVDHVDRRFEAARVETGERIDALKAELSARIDSVGARIDATRSELNGRIDGVGARIDATRSELNVRIDGVDARIDSVGARIDATRSELLERIDTSAAKTRRHVGVWMEGLQSTIQLLAESIVTVDQKHDRLHAGLGTEVKGLDRRVTRLEARVRPRKPPGKRRRG
jgi:tetrahydromethanopterin S-methyltransferase subunit G